MARVRLTEAEGAVQRLIALIGWRTTDGAAFGESQAEVGS
jgi:hypothetical protein